MVNPKYFLWTELLNLALQCQLQNIFAPVVASSARRERVFMYSINRTKT